MSEPIDNGLIKIAILAVGGQGGGVLSNWVVDVAEKNGYRVQSTSVAGVAQRTGATIYYIEMAPDEGREPVFSLAPAAADVDIVIAAELMEAGRAILRGFVQPDHTTLIMSTHRALAVSEKIKPGSGIANSQKTLSAAKRASKRLIAFDMERVAVNAGSVISASLFGALAGAHVLPFDLSAFETVVKASRQGADASLKAFHAARERAIDPATDVQAADTDQPSNPSGPPALLHQWRDLRKRIDALPVPIQVMAFAGLRKVVDYQDLNYGIEYLDRLESLVDEDQQHDGEHHGYTFSVACSRHLANAITYDDVIRVADLKTRRSRMDRIHIEGGLNDKNAIKITEYFHPRGEEFCGLLPAKLGEWVDARPSRIKTLDRWVNRGRRIRTDTLFGFTLLHFASSLRRWRRKLWRHQVEMKHVDNWLNLALNQLPNNYGLAIELINCRRLIKGYSDTHARSQSRYARIVNTLPKFASRVDAAKVLQGLMNTALDDDKDEILDRALEKL